MLLSIDYYLEYEKRVTMRDRYHSLESLQLWQLSPVPGSDCCMIVNPTTMKALYVDDKMETVQIRDVKRMEPRQYWKRSKDSMVNPFTGKTLIVNNHMNGEKNSRWRIQRINDLVPDLYNIIDPNTMKAITVQPRVPNGAQVVIRSNRDWTNEWYIMATGKSRFKIINPVTGKAIDVQGCRPNAGTPVIVWDHHQVESQEWIWSGEGTGAVWVNADSGKALDVYHSGWKDGTQVHIWGRNDTDAQIWKVQLIGE